MNGKALILALVLPVAAAAQGYADLGADGEGYALPERGPFDFPADHGPHPDFRIEWWYVTATLTAEDGTPMGLQWTLFRSAIAPEGSDDGWASRQLWMSHAAVTTPDRHLVGERFARGGIGQAGVERDPFHAWIDDWAMASEDAHIDDVRLAASGADFAYDVRLTAEGPLVAQGEGGYSVKSPEGAASRYYSQPFYAVEGTVTLAAADGPREVAVTGDAWLDREWSSQMLDEDQEGWDWFALHFDDGARLMAAQIRATDGPPFGIATWIAADGTATPYPSGAFTATPLGTSEVAGREVPTRWRVELPERGLDAEVAALNEDAWMDTAFPYWEGPIRITGSHSGRGYLEMTGYE